MRDGTAGVKSSPLGAICPAASRLRVTDDFQVSKSNIPGFFSSARARSVPTPATRSTPTPNVAHARAMPAPLTYAAGEGFTTGLAMRYARNLMTMVFAALSPSRWRRSPRAKAQSNTPNILTRFRNSEPP